MIIKILVGLVFFLCGSIIFFMMMRNKKLKRFGINSIATVIDKSIIDRDSDDIYQIIYQYSVAGKVFKKTVFTSSETYNSLQKGSSVPIIYNPESPTHSDLAVNVTANDKQWHNLLIVLGLIIAAYLIGRYYSLEIWTYLEANLKAIVN